jgi:hypothetical protein
VSRSDIEQVVPLLFLSLWLASYKAPGREYADHETVNHSAKEYSRKGRRGRTVTTNTVEGYFSVFKTRDDRRLPALFREASATLSERIRFPIQQPAKARRR